MIYVAKDREVDLKMVVRLEGSSARVYISRNRLREELDKDVLPLFRRSPVEVTRMLSNGQWFYLNAGKLGDGNAATSRRVE